MRTGLGVHNSFLGLHSSFPWASTAPATPLHLVGGFPTTETAPRLPVDLIFGFKQRGEAAEAAHNVFCPHTYEGRIDIDAEMEEHARRAIELQVRRPRSSSRCTRRTRRM